MNSAFSPLLSLADLSDYLSPSQVCIKPVQSHKIDDAQVEFQVTTDDNPQLKKAEITLSDCLACSGCITSAESILVSRQSYDEVFRSLKSNPDLVPVITISPQSLASLAAFHKITKKASLRGLRHFFKTFLGFRLVLDTTFAHSLVLQQASTEILSAMCSSSSSSRFTERPFPILSAACPGFVCFAEKTRASADTLVPRLSRVKSAMAAMGWIVKEGWLSSKLNVPSNRIYHISIMMCFDKKLEASRSDFYSSQQSITESSLGEPSRQIDCVLTTGEVQELMESQGFSLALYQPSDSLDEEDNILPSIPAHAGTSSGGFLHNAIHTYLTSLPPHRLSHIRLETSRNRGAEDFTDYYVIENNTVIFKGAKCYGFKNLQNMVRRISKSASQPIQLKSNRRRARGKADGEDLNSSILGDEKGYDYIEVMACPSGCVNGGGQICSSTIKQDLEGTSVADNGKSWIDAVEKAYWDDHVTIRADSGDIHHTILPFLVPKFETDQIVRLQRELMMNSDWLETSYRIVEDENVNGLAVKW